MTLIVRSILYIAILTGIPSFGQSSGESLFTEVSPKKSKFDFENQLIETDSLNYFLEDDLYNGAGVAVGDINNDGLQDIYMVSNFGVDQLFLNKGDLKFKNITSQAFEESITSGWKVAASMADVNGDGWLDIYVCRRGLKSDEGRDRQNLLYINNGDLTFTEKAAEMGVNDFGRSMDADFLDFDQDGDLDLWVTNRRHNNSVLDIYNKNTQLEKLHSNRLFRNDGDTFTDITTRASGLRSFGYCLSSSVADLNGDLWPDIYVSGDYELPDFMFINDGAGNFKNQIRYRTRHTTHYSMGVDIADFNNDGWMDIFVLDMANTDYEKSKTNMASMSVPEFWDAVARGYNHQYMYNSLQMNLSHGYFTEIAHMTGIASSDWSWAPLVADFDGDGQKDLFITNGYLRDVRNQDFTARLKEYLQTNPTEFDWKKMLEDIPVSEEINFFFKNTGDLSFDDQSSSSGLQSPTVSSGAAYADLDNDGDLDIVINNLNQQAQILQNNSTKNYIQFSFKGPSKNSKGIGTKVILKLDDGIELIQELYPSRGYASSSEYRLTFGLGSKKIEKATIYWNPLEFTEIVKPELNQHLVLDYSKTKKTKLLDNFNPFAYIKPQNHEFVKVQQEKFDDFKYEILLPHKMSELGPFVSKADVNGDGQEDLFVGGNRNYSGKIYLAEGTEFKLSYQPALKADSLFDDGGSTFFDADGDGDLDLYVASGGNEYKKNSPAFQDRLYLNDGKGQFSKADSLLPKIIVSGQVVVAEDIDSDGDMDLFIGGRQVPGEYPTRPSSLLLINENGVFKNKSDELAPEFSMLGMITDAEFIDINSDGQKDLIVVGEWMAPEVFLNKDGKFNRQSNFLGDQAMNGWWNCVLPFDVDGDGVNEIMLGNLGLNNKFHPNADEGLKIYLKDFDSNGKKDIVLSKYFAGIEHPVRGRECLSDQIPEISEKYDTYEKFATTSFNELLDLPDDFQFINNMSSGYLKKEGDKWVFYVLPKFAQMGPINRFVKGDVNGDGRDDLIAVGNRYEAEIETPRYDGNPGIILISKDDPKNPFEVMTLQQVGINVNKNAKDAVRIGSDLFISNSGENIVRYPIFF